MLGRDQQGGYWIQGNMRNDLGRALNGSELTEMPGAANSKLCERIAFNFIGKIAESRARA